MQHTKEMGAEQKPSEVSLSKGARIFVNKGTKEHPVWVDIGPCSPLEFKDSFHEIISI